MKMSNIVRFDWAIKYLLRNKANFCVLEGFLTELLEMPVEIESILDSESNKENKDAKSNRVDLLVKTSNDRRIIIEVQGFSEWDFLSRVLFGAAKVITESIKCGGEYVNICKVISVSIVFFDLGKGEDYIYKGKTDFVGMHFQDKLQLDKNEQKFYNYTVKEPSEIFPEYYILKVNQFDERIQSKIDQWMYFFKKEAIRQEFDAKGLKEAYERLSVLKLSEAERRDYDNYLKDLMHENSMLKSSHFDGFEDGHKKGKVVGIEEGRVQGIEEGRVQGIEEGRVQGIEEGRIQGIEVGIEKGKEQERLSIAKIMKQRGVSDNEIYQLLGVDPAELLEEV